MSMRSALIVVCVATALVAAACPAWANLVAIGDFETSYPDNYIAPAVTGGMPVIVGSTVWDTEVVGAWVRNSDHSAWHSADPAGVQGQVANLRKAGNGFMQAIDAAGLVPGTELTLKYKLYLQPAASDAATIYVRLLAVTAAGAGEIDTTVNCGPVADLSSILAGEMTNAAQLGDANTPVASAVREQWQQISVPVIYPGGHDYLVVVIGYSGAATITWSTTWKSSSRRWSPTPGRTNRCWTPTPPAMN